MLLPIRVAQLERLRAALRAGRSNFLLYGPRGTGKRFVARELAKAIGYRFVELNLGVMSRAAPPAARPFGEVEAFAASYFHNEFASDASRDALLLYLSNIE